MKTLEQIIEDASRLSERAFAEVGGVCAHWFVITRDGQQSIIPPLEGTPNKLVAAPLVRKLLEMVDAVRVVFVDEAWTVDGIGDEQMAAIRKWYETHDGIEGYPGCVEVLVLHGEDEDGRLVNGWRRIIRTADKVMLGPLKIDYPKSTEGRLAAWLPVRGTKQ